MSNDGVYVCADLGVNWCGKFDLLTKMMKTCSWRGVDAVKVQYFDKEYLEANKADYTPELRKRLDKMVLNLSHLYTLSCVAKELEHKVDFIVTPFSAKLAENLKDIPLDGIKIRSNDWLNKEMWDAVKDLNVQRYVSVPYDNNQAMIGKADGPTVAWAMGRRGGGNHRVYCFPNDGNFVLTSSGAKQIGEVVIGDYVLTHVGRWKRVTRTSGRPYNGEIVQLLARGILPITCTPEHLILASHSEQTNHKDYKSKLTEPIWTSASDLKKNNFYKDQGALLYSPNMNFHALEIDGGLAYLYGLYLAEGSLHSSGIQFSLGSHESEIIDGLVEKGREAWNAEPSIMEQGSETHIVFCRRKLKSEFGASFYSSGGYTAFWKTVPSNLMPMPRAMLDGFWDGDGSEDARSMSFATVSPSLAWQIFASLQSLRTIAPNIHQRSQADTIMGRKVNCNPLFEIRHCKDMDKKCYCLAMNGGRLRSMIENRRLHYDGLVYNLDVEEDHSYMLNGVAVHNCVAKYPPTLEELNLTNVTQHDGFSSHYPDHHVPLMAATLAVNNQLRMGKRRFYLEVHFRPDHIRRDFLPDANVSLERYGLGDLCHGVDMLEKAIG